MRILSSPKVVESAELVARRIVDSYLTPNKTFLELRQMVNSGTIDLLRDFSETCCAEFESLRSQFRRGSLCFVQIATWSRIRTQEVLPVFANCASTSFLDGLDGSP